MTGNDNVNWKNQDAESYLFYGNSVKTWMQMDKN